MRTWPRLGSAVAVLGAALVGFHLGAARTASASAEKDQAKVLLDMDRKFDEATFKSGVEAWMSYCAEDAMLLLDGSPIVAGREAIRKALSPNFQAPGFTLRWVPMDAYVSGDLGYTYGVWKSSSPDEDGKPKVSYGKYVTIWRKQRNGVWRLALDIGNSSPAPQSKK